MCAVWLLQATNIMQLWNDDDGTRRRLLQVEQRPRDAVLRVRFLQSRGAGECEKGLAQAVSTEYSDDNCSHWHLFDWLLCIPQHQEG